MHIMHALVGCQKRSTKSLTRSLQPIEGAAAWLGSRSRCYVVRDTAVRQSDVLRERHADVRVRSPLAGRGRQVRGRDRTTAKKAPAAKTLATKSPATKTKPRASTPSALIDARIDELGDWRGATLARLRALIHEAAPDVVEEWKWRGVPVWEDHGIVCTGETYRASSTRRSPRARRCPTRPGSSTRASKGTFAARSTSTKARRSTRRR
jgi:hypothetical protein